MDLDEARLEKKCRPGSMVGSMVLVLFAKVGDNVS